MYWYKFEEEEIQLAQRQAYSQARDADSDRGAKTHRKTVGNLGEYAVEAFLEDFAHPARWDYVNEEARVGDEPEYEPYDFVLNGTRVDVKSTTNLLKLEPTSIIMGGPEYGFHSISEDDEAMIYIFVLIDRNVWPVDDTDGEGPKHEAALILGYATYEDLFRESFVSYGKSSRGEGVFLPFNNIYELLLRLGCTESASDE